MYTITHTFEGIGYLLPFEKEAMKSTLDEVGKRIGLTYKLIEEDFSAVKRQLLIISLPEASNMEKTIQGAFYIGMLVMQTIKTAH